MKKGVLGFIIVLVILVVIVGGCWGGSYNSFMTLKETVNKSMAEVDNQLKRRADLIPNLVETVKGYAGQEKSIFTEIAASRSKLLQAMNSGNTEEKIKAANQFESTLSKLNFLSLQEAYPELKSNQQFTQLMDELAGTENRLTVARKRYNDSVNEYNVKVKKFPDMFIANMSGFRELPYFEVSEAEKATPKVDFGNNK